MGLGIRKMKRFGENNAIVVMRLTGFPDDSSVPITWAYNHHYEHICVKILIFKSTVKMIGQFNRFAKQIGKLIIHLL